MYNSSVSPATVAVLVLSALLPLQATACCSTTLILRASYSYVGASMAQDYAAKPKVSTSTYLLSQHALQLLLLQLLLLSRAAD
jgi:hypothetical protein